MFSILPGGSPERAGHRTTLEYVSAGLWVSGPLEPDPEGLMTSGSLGGGQRQASEMQRQTCRRGAASVCWRRGFPLCPDRLRLWKWSEFAWRRAGREWKRSTLTFCHVIQERERGVRERDCVCVCVRACECVWTLRGGGWLMACWSLWASCEVLPVITLPNLDPGFEWITETFFLWPPSHWLCLRVILSTLWGTGGWVREPRKEVGPHTTPATTPALLHSRLSGS